MFSDPFEPPRAPGIALPDVIKAQRAVASVAWAVEHLRVSERTVLRYADSGKLTKWQPRRGSRERNWFLLYVDEVRELKAARDRAGRGRP